MPDTAPDRSHIPHACGVYLMRDAARSILYIGKAKDLAKRVAQYFNPNRPDPKNSALAPLVRSIDYIPCASEREALILERRLIHAHQPFFNSMWKDGKTYPFVKITLNEDFPRMLLTRRKAADGGAYFGPYPKVTPIRGLLNYLWRQKFFPLRPCRWEFNLQKPLDGRKIRSCLYYHTKECPAPCAGRITTENYRKIADNAVDFFKGKYVKLRKKFKQEMQAASGRLEFEKAAALRDNRGPRKWARGSRSGRCRPTPRRAPHGKPLRLGSPTGPGPVQAPVPYRMLRHLPFRRETNRRLHGVFSRRAAPQGPLPAL